jgi:hypothetical protein
LKVVPLKERVCVPVRPVPKASQPCWLGREVAEAL